MIPDEWYDRFECLARELACERVYLESHSYTHITRFDTAAVPGYVYAPWVPFYVNGREAKEAWSVLFSIAGCTA